MNTHTPNTVRRTTICAALAMAIAVPGIATAGIFDQAKGRAQAVKAKVSSRANNVRQALPNAAGAISDLQFIEQIKQLNLREQLMDTIHLMQQIQADYQHFTGGSGCAAECADFRDDLKGLIDDVLALIYEVPVLNTNGALADNLARVANLVDYIPPRALYLMWQALAGQLYAFREAVHALREDLATLPPMADDAEGGAALQTQTTTGQTQGNTGFARFCDWVDQDKPVVDLIRARLEMFAWRLKSAADIIPDVEVKGEAGGSVGVQANAGVGIKPTDQVKMVLQLIAYVPERIDWAIEINTLRAKVACAYR